MKNISIKESKELLLPVTGLKSKEVLKEIGTIGDVESLTGDVDHDLLEKFDVEAVSVGLAAAASALSMVEQTTGLVPYRALDEGVKLLPDADTENYLSTPTFDLELFDPRKESAVAPFAFSLAANTMTGDAGLDQMYPTVNVPANAEGVLLSLIYGFNKTKFKRDDVNISGSTRINENSILAGLRSPSTVRSDANLLVPVKTAETEHLLDVDFTNDTFKHPTTGETISTAPIKFDTKFDLTTISHTAKLVTEGVFADETNLDIGGRITYIYGTVGADKLKLDVSSLPMNEIITGGSGDSKDIVLNISTEALVIDPATIKQNDGTAPVELAGVPAGLRLVYALDINGNGNMVTCDWGVRKPTIKLIKVIDVDGQSVDMLDGDGKTAADIGVQLDLTGYDLYQTVTNADLRVIANVVDVNEVAQRIGIPYGALDVYERTILSDNKGPHALTRVLSVATIKSLTRRRDIQQKALNEVLGSAGTAANGGRTKTITSVAVEPYNKSTSIDLADMLDGEEHGKREEDIAALITARIKEVIPAILFDTNYSALSKAYGRSKPGIGITFGTDLLAFMPTEIEVAGVVVKIAMTEVDTYKSDIFVYPVDTEFNSNEPTPLNFGMRLAKPDIVVTGRFDKIDGTFIVPRNRAVNTLSILHRFEVTQLNASLGKITSNQNVI